MNYHYSQRETITAAVEQKLLELRPHWDIKNFGTCIQISADHVIIKVCPDLDRQYIHILTYTSQDRSCDNPDICDSIQLANPALFNLIVSNIEIIMKHYG